MGLVKRLTARAAEATLQGFVSGLVHALFFPTPGKTISDLHALTNLGFTNQHFSRVHHRAGTTIHSHLHYLSRRTRYNLGVPGSNSDVAGRLRFVLKKAVAIEKVSDVQFHELIDEALEKYPM